MIDASLIKTEHLFLFLIGFLFTFFALKTISNRRFKHFFSSPQKTNDLNRIGKLSFSSPRYAGLIPAFIIGVLGAVIITNFPLKFSLLVSIILIIVIGFIDEKKNLSPFKQLAAQTIITLTVFGGGWTIKYVSHPLKEEVISLSALFPSSINYLGLIATISWFIFLMNSINWIDGVDGLASGVGVIAFIMLALISVMPSTHHLLTFKLSLIGASVFLAFLVWNWPPAKFYLGTTGSWLLGLFLGCCAIIGGGKILTTLLIIFIPALDALAVVLQRLLSRRAPWQSDNFTHLHYRLLKKGFSPQTISFLALILSAGFGTISLLLQTFHKLWLLVILGIIMISVSLILWRIEKPETIPPTSRK